MKKGHQRKYKASHSNGKRSPKEPIFQFQYLHTSWGGGVEEGEKKNKQKTKN